METADVLVVAAHPDDAEFGAAGTVARWAREGRRVVYVLCTSGEKGTGDRTADPRELASRREREQEAAAEVLGVAQTLFLRRPDQGLEDSAEFRKEIVRMLRAHRPGIVVTSDPYRRYLWHRDHRIVGQVVLDAVFPFARDHLAYPDLLTQGYEPHKVREVWLWGAETPNHWVDVSETLSLKVEALGRHRSQIAEMGIANLEAWLRQRCGEAAQGTSLPLAEAFHRVVAPP